MSNHVSQYFLRKTSFSLVHSFIYNPNLKPRLYERYSDYNCHLPSFLAYNQVRMNDYLFDGRFQTKKYGEVWKYQVDTKDLGVPLESNLDLVYQFFSNYAGYREETTYGEAHKLVVYSPFYLEEELCYFDNCQLSFSEYCNYPKDTEFHSQANGLRGSTGTEFKPDDYAISPDDLPQKNRGLIPAVNLYFKQKLEIDGNNSQGEYKGFLPVTNLETLPDYRPEPIKLIELLIGLKQIEIK